MRLVLILALLLAPLAGPRATVDPALAMARAAGSLCLADGQHGMPADGHDPCQACHFAVGWAGMVPVGVAVAVAPARQAATWRPGDHHARGPARPAYASRAPPVEPV